MRIKVNRQYRRMIGDDYGTLEVSLPNEFIERIEAFVRHRGNADADTRRGVFIHTAIECYLDRHEEAKRAEAYLREELDGVPA